MLNMIAAIGRLTHTPELRTTTSGKEICSFDVACERSYSANGQRETDFLPCVAWGKTAQFISQYFDKGSMIAVNGSLQTRKYQDKQATTALPMRFRCVRSAFAARKPLTTRLHGVLMNRRKVMPAKLETLRAPSRRLRPARTILPLSTTMKICRSERQK